MPPTGVTCGAAAPPAIVYAFTTDPRAGPAQALLRRGCFTSVQALNEFTNVARRKLGMTWREVHDALAAIRTLCRSILPLDIETHRDAVRIAERYGYAIFDALIISAALRARCTVLYSEDMHDGMTIDRRLRSWIRIASPEPQPRADWQEPFCRIICLGDRAHAQAGCLLDLPFIFRMNSRLIIAKKSNEPKKARQISILSLPAT